jgi:biopolymer transport protein ExbB/TolQ
MLTEALVQVALLGAEWVLYLILILSVLSVALIIERLLVFRRSVRCLTVLEEKWLGIPSGGTSKGVNVEGSTECRLVAAAEEASLEQVDSDKLAAQIQGITNNYRRHLERFTAFLGTLGNNAPFVGLLGTVIGIIQAFHALKFNVEGGASAVMGGISEALVATAAGLFVAIPAVVAYNFMSKKIDEYVERFELVAWTRVTGGRKK